MALGPENLDSDRPAVQHRLFTTAVEEISKTVLRGGSKKLVGGRNHRLRLSSEVSVCEGIPAAGDFFGGAESPKDPDSDSFTDFRGGTSLGRDLTPQTGELCMIQRVDLE